MAYQAGGWCDWHFEVLSEGDRYRYFTQWELFNNVTDSQISGQVDSAYTSGLTVQTSTYTTQQINITGTSGACSGNAATATTASGVTSALLTTLVKTMYPVGSIYITITSTNPGATGGVFASYGMTWVAFGSGRVPVGVGSATDAASVTKTLASAAESTGGRFAPSMPSHTHSHTLTVDSKSLTGHIKGASTQNSSATRADGVFSENTTWNAGDKVGNSSGWVSRGVYMDASHSHTLSGSITSASSGDTATGNAMPYIGVYMWKRTA